MKTGFTSEHFYDANGKPAGGHSEGVGFYIDWQNGPLVTAAGVRREPTGAFVENVIAAACDRIEYYQSGEFACRENALAITKLEEALHWLNHRTANRVARGVEGTHNA